MTPGDSRTVLVTGANSGVGLATVLHLARLGFRSVGSVRSRAKAASVLEAAASASVTVETVLLDVTDAERCRRVVNRLRPWALVNNAGYSGVGAIEDVTDQEARRQLETMVVAPMRLARLSLPHMRSLGQGRVVNISSVYGLATTPFSGWYQASKHALEAASDALRVEVARDGVNVILIEPGGVKTGIWEEMKGELDRRADSATKPNTGGFWPCSSRTWSSWSAPKRWPRSSGRPSPPSRRLRGTSWAGTPRALLPPSVWSRPKRATASHGS